MNGDFVGVTLNRAKGKGKSKRDESLMTLRSLATSAPEKQQGFRRRGRDACRGPFESLLFDACVLSVYAP
ncbi:hypothetical protein QA640_22710 [Bradyrhizobium sp. CB82]|uniref:hypothetical protein n=1 Tax=Bradyrhizobium sp. CB82 TaxID=3039159 RepID=UPI0024B244A5|nr:hypothetical protein [Bradyrhizobium sp. CB82]WFU45371.1 hypothetical protein QA640_22710 [Bradyrhizobium sp. CB82]